MKKYIVILFCCINVFAQPGSYDTTFSGDGISKDCQTYTYFSMDGSFQSDGKIVSFGSNYQSNRISLLRYNSVGNIDTTFGIGGFFQGNMNPIFPLNRSYIPYSMAIQPDDKIIIMGTQGSEAFGNGFWIARLLPNGSADTTFNGTGYLDLYFGTTQDRGRCIKLQSDGKIIVAGKSGNLGHNFAMARINSNGTLDDTFGIGGKVQTTLLDTQSEVNSIAIQVDGKIILGGATDNQPYAYDFALIRYNSDGSIDTSFGTNGKVITTLNTSFSDIVTKIIIQEDGKILAGGFSSREYDSKFAMVRYLPNGAIDTSFGSNGILISNYNSANADSTLQTDGKILMVGGFDLGVFTVLRFYNNGSLDTTFGNNGVVYVLPGTGGYGGKVLIQPDNKIVVCGSIGDLDNNVLCSTVVRLNPGTLSNETFTKTKTVIYPNPTNGNVFFDNSVNQYESVSSYNYLGQKLATKKLDFSNNESFDTSSCSKGVYLLKFEKENANEVVKIVKE